MIHNDCVNRDGGPEKLVEGSIGKAYFMGYLGRFPIGLALTGPALGFAVLQAPFFWLLKILGLGFANFG